MASQEKDAEPEGTNRRDSQLLARETGTNWAELLAILLLISTFTVAGGFGGAVAGFVSAGVLFVFGVPYAVAVGVVVVTALTPPGGDLFSAGLVGVGLFGLVVAPAVTASTPKAYAAVVFLLTALFGGITWFLVDTQPLWLGSFTLLGTGGLVMYGLHRYQLLRLGLLDYDTQSTVDHTDDTPGTATDET